MSSFIPLPPELDLSHVEPVKLTKEQEEIFNAYLEMEKENFLATAMAEWADAKKKKKKSHPSA